MNSTATRRSVSTPVVDGSLDENLLRGLRASPLVTRGRNRGKSMARGLSVSSHTAVLMPFWWSLLEFYFCGRCLSGRIISCLPERLDNPMSVFSFCTRLSS